MEISPIQGMTSPVFVHWRPSPLPPGSGAWPSVLTSSCGSYCIGSHWTLPPALALTLASSRGQCPCALGEPCFSHTSPHTPPVPCLVHLPICLGLEDRPVAVKTAHQELGHCGLSLTSYGPQCFQLQNGDSSPDPDERTHPSHHAASVPLSHLPAYPACTATLARPGLGHPFSSLPTLVLSPPERLPVLPSLRDHSLQTLDLASSPKPRAKTCVLPVRGLLGRPSLRGEERPDSCPLGSQSLGFAQPVSLFVQRGSRGAMERNAPESSARYPARGRCSVTGNLD